MSDQIKTFQGIFTRIKKHFWHLAGAIVAGFLLAYSLTTRIGLLFIIPLWLKFVVLLGLSINLGVLWLYLSSKYVETLKQNRLWLWILATGAALSVLIFVLTPYQRVPFRTTHSLEIEALESKVVLKAIYSPDDNLMRRDEFSISDGVTPVDEAGFQLAPASSIQYKQAHTGKLTLLFTQNSGPALISWDGQQETFNPQVEGERNFHSDGWHIASEPENMIKVTLPGNRWGKPDRMWTILGGLLPISDFFTLTTLAACLGWVVIGIQRQTLKLSIHRKLIRVWVDGLLCLGFATLMIRVGFPDFEPAWFLVFFIPAMVYLLYQQIKTLADLANIEIKPLSKFQHFLQKSAKLLNRINQNKWVFIVLLLIIATLGSVIQLQLTSPGMGISGDSVHYMVGGKNLALGKGYVLDITEGEPEPITGFEPVYSALLAAGTLVGVEVVQFARLLNTVLFFMTMIMMGWIIFKTTGRVIPTVFGIGFFLLSPLILNIFAWAMSEPVFIVFLLGTLLVWLWHLSNPTIWRALFTGVIASFMINTRFAGIVFLGALAIISLLLEKIKFHVRMRNAFVMGLAGVTPYAIFFIRNLFVTRTSPESETASLGIFPQEYWETIGAEVSSWFKWQNYFNYPHQRFNALFISLGVLVLLVILWFVFRKKLIKNAQIDPVITFCVAAIPLYLAAIILNTVFLTANPTASGLIRYLIPILLLVIILLSKLFSTYWRQPLLFQKLFILFILLISLFTYITDASKIIRDQPVLYRNYTDRKAQCGDEVTFIIDQNPEKTFYTNNCEYFYFMTGLQCRNLTHDQNAYANGGEIYRTVKDGTIIVVSDGFGTSIPPAEAFLEELDYVDSACYLNFYRWPIVEK